MWFSLLSFSLHILTALRGRGDNIYFLHHSDLCWRKQRSQTTEQNFIGFNLWSVRVNRGSDAAKRFRRPVTNQVKHVKLFCQCPDLNCEDERKVTLIAIEASLTFNFKLEKYTKQVTMKRDHSLNYYYLISNTFKLCRVRCWHLVAKGITCIVHLILLGTDFPQFL